MTARITTALILPLLFLSLTCSDHQEEMLIKDKVFIYSKGTPQQITQPDTLQKIIKETTRLLAQADDIYLKSISKRDIDNFRESICVEILFAHPKDIIIRAIKQKKAIFKILIPLDESMCTNYAHIIYGDPDYNPFNLLLNSEGCESLQKIIKDKSLGIE